MSSRNSFVHGKIQSFAVSNPKTFSGEKSQTSNIEKSQGENYSTLPSEDTVRLPNFTEVVCRSFKYTCVTFVVLTTGIFETVRDTVKLKYEPSSSIIQGQQIDEAKSSKIHRRLFTVREIWVWFKLYIAYSFFAITDVGLTIFSFLNVMGDFTFYYTGVKSYLNYRFWYFQTFFIVGTCRRYDSPFACP